MRISTILYCIREALVSILRNGWMTVASISIVAVSLVILGGSVLLVMNTGYLTQRLESKVEISVFLEEELAAADVKEIGEKIKSTAGVAEVKFIPKEKALQEMKKSLGSRAQVLEDLEKNPLPDAYRVKAEDANQVPALAGSFEQLDGVEMVRYGKGVVEKLLSVTQWLRVASWTLMGILGVSALFLISTSIRMSVFARRREISIMKLLGATNWYIRAPFLMEGLIMGLAGALLAVAVVYLGYIALVDKIKVSLPFINLVPGEEVFTVVPGALLGLGILIGIFGSLISIHRFLSDKKA
ncbi:cell division transport system permease protein [Desulfohalotomaculum tongense]|uniref:permease-like cell division protein FtsX n=1 Tax=Desulforadius tongensis TaxID=1216062 RepID=UPI00195741DA|nr:permease-like cell division protein FtsX [Desulforadius tongensis]MBM7853665.1 cell division transport system permease protein [Desulforadius tongensis]